MTLVSFLLLTHLLAPRTHGQGSTCESLADSVATAAQRSPKVVQAAESRLERNCRDNFDALFTAGRALGRAAESGVTDLNRLFRDRAERLLSRSVALRPKNAAAWFEYGRLLRRRGVVQFDARRALQRSLELAERYPDSTPPTLLADVFVEIARSLQAAVDALRWLKDGARLGVFTPSCASIGTFCENYTAPARFNDELRDAPLLDHDYWNRREELLSLYRRAVQLNPANLDVARSYARELALGGEWENMATGARWLEEEDGKHAFLALVRALALDKLGMFRDADSLFRRLIPELPDSLRRWYAQPPPPLDTIRDFWVRARPYWVVPFNELWVEHASRVTYAALVYGDQESNLVGPETPMGDALLRYGWPTAVTQVNRDSRKLLSGSRQYAIENFLTCVPADAGGDPSNCEVGAAQGIARDEGGGRWIMWTYAMDRPSLIFELVPGQRNARPMRESQAEAYAQQIRTATPLTFRSQVVSHAFRLPVQVARFKGSGLDEAVVGIFAIVPLNSMGVAEDDSISTGVFTFRDTVGLPVENSAIRRAGGRAVTLDYWVPLSAGRHVYSVEAFALNTGVGARTRDTLVTPEWRVDSLMISDILIAHRVEAKSDGAPKSVRDLTIEPSRTLEVRPGATVWVVWEIYGLASSESGEVRFEVSMTVRDLNANSLPLRLLERLGLRQRAVTNTGLHWSSVRRAAPDGRVLDYVAIQLPDEANGEFEVNVTVSESGTHRSISGTRTIIVKRE